MQLPLDRLHFINSPIHPEIYSQPQQRATTFDNAIDLGRFLKQQQQLGVLSSKDPIVLCIERPFAVRMHMIVQDVLSHFIDNPVHLHTSTAYPDVPLKVGVNQAYMVPKAALDYQTNVLPLITSYAQTLQCPSSSRWGSLGSDLAATTRWELVNTLIVGIVRLNRWVSFSLSFNSFWQFCCLKKFPGRFYLQSFCLKHCYLGIPCLCLRWRCTRQQ